MNHNIAQADGAIRRFFIRAAVLAIAVVCGFGIMALVSPEKTRVGFYTDRTTGCQYIVARLGGSISITPRQLEDGVQICVAPEVDTPEPHRPKLLPPFKGQLGNGGEEWERPV